MRRLVLIRHSLPDIRPDMPAARWSLSAAGLARARAFAARIDPRDADRLFTSSEAKAVQTARALAEVWMLPVEEVAGLHEHERPEARILAPAEFESRVGELFARPKEVVFGAETADAARRRFTDAVLQLVQRTERDVLVVAHGTVMALFVGAHARMDPYVCWKQQEMPCAITLALPDFRVEGMTLLDGTRN